MSAATIFVGLSRPSKELAERTHDADAAAPERGPGLHELHRQATGRCNLISERRSLCHRGRRFAHRGGSPLAAAPIAAAGEMANALLPVILMD
jgi:hypothetical protein